MGIGEDLQLYHNGSNSFIQHLGTGGLYIDALNNSADIVLRSQDNINLYTNAASQSSIACVGNGGVILYNQGNARFNTDADGAVITEKRLAINRNAGDPFIEFQTSGTTNATCYGGASSGFRVFTKPSGGSLTERFRISNSGDVNIGSAADARKRLDITGPDGRSGASSGNSDTALIIDNDGTNGAIMEFLSDNNAYGRIFFTDTDASNRGQIVYEHSNDNFQISTAGSEKLRIRTPGSNRGQLEVVGNFNESTVPAIEINDGGDARKVFITNSSGDLNLLTRNGSQTKGQLKMFESGVFFHAQKDPDSTNLLQTFRAHTYRNQTGSTNPSTTPDQTILQKGGSGTYDCFYEGNMTLTVNGTSSSDHYQPVAFVPLGYDLDTSSFGGQWAGEMWIHQNGSQNPTNYGYDSSSYNTWATMSFKCKWDCAHWNAKPNGFWVEHYINQGRGNIGKIDNSSTMSQFVIYLLPGYYHIRYNCVRGMAVHRASSAGGSITLRDGGSMRTYSTLAYSSRNTSFDSEIAPGSANGAHAS